MTNRRVTKMSRSSGSGRRRPAGRSRSRTLVPLGLAAAALAVGIALLATRPTGGPSEAALGPTPAATGEVNEMGLPVVTTPGSTSGIATAGGVEVTGAVWEMGQVPLEVAVRPSWTLVNTSSSPVSFGEPHPEVRAGCCPGPFTFGARELAPGEATTLTFELAMHPGMDGWHDIAVHVPVVSETGAENVLGLAVTGDFRGTFAG
jgi:hypothetical protein